MKKNRVMGDPVLDRIFGEAYADTMRQAATLERDKRLADNIGAFVEMFEDELSGRDLSATERDHLVREFRRRLDSADKVRDKRKIAHKNRNRAWATIAGGFAVLAFITLLITFRPLKPMETITADLDHYIAEVDDGKRDYAKDFYKLIDRYERRLGDNQVDSYRNEMYRVLDERFNEILEKVVAGNITFADNARRWAKSFPEKAEQRIRKELIEDATLGAVGEAVKKGFGRAVDWLQGVADSIIDKAEKAPKTDE